MIKEILGRKIGMTQIFCANNKDEVIPVTAVAIDPCYVLQVKTVAHDGYDAVQAGILKKRYSLLPFSLEWLKNKKQYFSKIKELVCTNVNNFTVGQLLSGADFCESGKKISVTGITIGKGFQGAVKRHGFTGGRGSHGDKLGRGPGSLSGLRTQGRVFKGKKMPGHMGVTQKTISGLSIVDYDKAANVVFISGPVAGKSGNFLVLSEGKK
jgi:large subunit ribosomal protein L3